MTAACVIDEGTDLTEILIGTDDDWSVDNSTYANVVQPFYLLDGTTRPIFSSKAAVTTSTPASYTATISANLSTYYSPCLQFDFEVAWLHYQFKQHPYVYTIQLSSTSDFSKYFQWTNTVETGMYYPRAGRQTVSVHSSEWTNTGSESWSNTMIRIRVQMRPVTSTYENTTQAIAFIAARGGVETTPVICFAMSNTFRTMLTQSYGMKALMAAHGLRGTYYCDPSDQEGQYAGNLKPTWQEVRDLIATGDWDFSGGVMPELLGTGIIHQTPCDWVDEEAMLAAYSYCHNLYVRQGLGQYWHPQFVTMGEVNSAHSYYEVIRPMEYHCGFASGKHNHQPLTRYMARTPRSTMPLYTTSLATVEGWVDECKTRGTMLGLHFQELVTGTPASGQWNSGDFEDLLDYIIAQEVEVMTVKDWLAFAYDAPLAGPNSVILGGLDLNDGVTYFVDNEGLNTGQRQTTWEEIPTYAGGVNVQVNVSRNVLVPVTIPMRVVGTTVYDLEEKLGNLWNVVDAPSNTLVVSGETFDIVSSTRPDSIERDPDHQFRYEAAFVLNLMRQP